MSLATYFETKGIAIEFYKPSIDLATPKYIPKGEIFADDIVNSIESYSHILSAEDGYKSAIIQFKVPYADLEKWFEEAVGLHSITLDSSTETCFEGFVNAVNVTIGRLSASRGPLLDLANRVIISYTPVNVDIYPPAQGNQTETVAAEDATSQNKYGIVEKIVAGGQLAVTGIDADSNDAIKIRDAYLLENKDLKTDQPQLTFSRESDLATVTLNILGYKSWLNAYVHNTYTTAYLWISERIKDLVQADPNGIFSENFTGIEDNVWLTTEFNDQNQTAWTQIQKLLTFGNDVDDSRRIFGVYKDRRIIYKPIPTDIKYYGSVTESLRYIRDSNNAAINPWNILPAEWLQITDLAISKGFEVETRKDSRNIFIESVNYAAPYDLVINGIKLRDIPQMIAKLGLGGTSS